MKSQKISLEIIVQNKSGKSDYITGLFLNIFKKEFLHIATLIQTLNLTQLCSLRY